MIRECVVCGKGFKCSPSDKKVTCSEECSRINKSITHKGKSNQWSVQSRKRLSERGKTANLEKGTEAAKESPNSGRCETNINAKEWHVVSPEGRHYKFRNLCNWARNNCDLFWMESTEENANKIEKGLQHAKAGEAGKEYANTNTYKGWRVVLDYNEYQEEKLAILTKRQREIVEMKISGIKNNEIAHILKIKPSVVSTTLRNARDRLHGKTEYSKEYYKNNKEKIKEQSGQYYSANKEILKEKSAENRRKYYEENRETLLEKKREYNKQYYQKNKDRILKKIKSGNKSISHIII